MPSTLGIWLVFVLFMDSSSKVRTLSISYGTKGGSASLEDAGYRVAT
jgi:hypothetical protein